MAKEVTYEEIVRNLKNRIYAPVYFLMGEEDYYIDRIADYIIDTVLSETEKEFNLTVTYGADTDVANVINAAKRYPMMSEYQVVVVKEAQSLKRIEELAFSCRSPRNRPYWWYATSTAALTAGRNWPPKSRKTECCSNRESSRTVRFQVSSPHT